MIYNDDYILVCPPKCGSMSVIKHLNEKYKWKSVSHFKTLSHSPFIPKSNQKKVLMLIRNPYERMISMYEYFLSRIDVINNLISGYTTDSFYEFLKGKSFQEFIHYYNIQRQDKKLTSNREDEINQFKDSLFYNMDLYRHVHISFLRSLKQYKEICNPSLFIRLENLENDFKQIGIETTFPIINKTVNKPNKSLSEYYTQETLQYCDFIKQDAIEFEYEVIE